MLKNGVFGFIVAGIVAILGVDVLVTESSSVRWAGLLAIFGGVSVALRAWASIKAATEDDATMQTGEAAAVGAQPLAGGGGMECQSRNADMHAEAWNKTSPIGTEVTYKKSDLEGKVILRTTTAAYVLGADPVVELEYIGIALLSKVSVTVPSAMSNAGAGEDVPRMVEKRLPHPLMVVAGWISVAAVIIALTSGSASVVIAMGVVICAIVAVAFVRERRDAAKADE